MPEILEALADTQFRRLLAALSPSAMLIGPDDGLRIRSFNSVGGVNLAIEGRRVEPDGTIVPFADRHVPASDRSEGTSLVNVGPGVLLNVSVRASAGAPRRGQCYVVLDVVRGFTGAIQPLACLLQGYVTDTSRRAWPDSPLELSAEGPGVLTTAAFTDPAAGVEISVTVPPNARWRPLALFYALVTDGTAANRESALVIDDGATVYARVPSGFTQTATLTVSYSAFHHAPRFTLAQDTTKNFPLPRIDMPTGHRLRTITTNLQAGDNYGLPHMLLEEWIED